MHIKFSNSNTEETLEKIKEELGGRKLGEMLSFNLDGDTLDVLIKKMGTSTLTFSISGKEWDLTGEKIAFAHKAFRGEVMDKIRKVIEKVGGVIEEV